MSLCQVGARLLAWGPALLEHPHLPRFTPPPSRTACERVLRAG